MCMRTRAISRAGMHKYQVQGCDGNNILHCGIFVDLSITELASYHAAGAGT